MPYTNYESPNFLVQTNRKKLEPEFIKLRNVSQAEIVLRRHSILFGFQEYRIPPGGTVLVETGMFTQYQCQAHVVAGRLKIVPAGADLPPDDDLPPAA